MGQKRARKTQQKRARKKTAARAPAPKPDGSAAPAAAAAPPAGTELWDQLQQHVLEIEHGLQELRASLSANDVVETIEPVLTEIRNDVDAGRAKSELAAASLDQVRDDLGELRSQIVAVGRIGLRVEAQLTDLTRKVERTQLEPLEGEMDLESFYDGIPEYETMPPIWERPTAITGWVTVVLVLSVVVFIVTGNLKLALGALAGANLVGCTAILLARKLL